MKKAENWILLFNALNKKAMSTKKVKKKTVNPKPQEKPEKVKMKTFKLRLSEQQAFFMCSFFEGQIVADLTLENLTVAEHKAILDNISKLFYSLPTNLQNDINSMVKTLKENVKTERGTLEHGRMVKKELNSGISTFNKQANKKNRKRKL